MEDDLYQQLAARFPSEDHKKVPKAGRDLTYVPAEKVISRLNAVLGFNWSYRVIREGYTEIEAWALGEMTLDIDGQLVSRQQYGCWPIVTGQQRKSVDDLLKKAATDALRKSATLFGVALYLYDEDERSEVEAEIRQAGRPQSNQRQNAPKQPLTAPTGSKTTKMTQNTGAPVNGPVREPVDLNMPIEQADGTISRARTCSATLDGGKVCGYKLYPGTTEEYRSKDGPKEFAVSELIARSLEEFQRVYCRPHFVGCLKAKREAEAAKAS